MATEKWIAGSGVGLTWTACFGAEANSLVNGNAIQSTVVINNSTALDLFSDISFNISSMSPVAPNYLGIYLYPLNQDGSTYGDNRFGSSAAGPPASTYWVGNIVLPVVTTTPVNGELRGIIMPPGSFVFVLYNQAGATLGSTVTAKYRTYNRQVA